LTGKGGCAWGQRPPLARQCLAAFTQLFSCATTRGHPGQVAASRISRHLFAADELTWLALAQSKQALELLKMVRSKQKQKKLLTRIYVLDSIQVHEFSRFISEFNRSSSFSARRHARGETHVVISSMLKIYRLSLSEIFRVANVYSYE